MRGAQILDLGNELKLSSLFEVSSAGSGVLRRGLSMRVRQAILAR